MANQKQTSGKGNPSRQGAEGPVHRTVHPAVVGAVVSGARHRGLLAIASSSDLPDTETLANPKTDLATRIYAVDGAQLGSFYRENRADVRYADLPPTLVQALICTEDVRFRDHTGVDFRGLARAIAYLGKKGGGSTVTQQLAKQLFTERYDRTGFFERAVLQKPKEWIIATRLERQYTKDEIIALYLNRYDFLNQAVGIRSAAQVYFGKNGRPAGPARVGHVGGHAQEQRLVQPVAPAGARARAAGNGDFADGQVRGGSGGSAGQPECSCLWASATSA